jgi:DNA-binding transcriptional MerR regulator
MRSAGIQIEALVEYVALFKQGDSTHAARKKILVEQRNQLNKRIAEMKSTLKRLNNKIEHYDKLLVPAQKKLNQQKTKKDFFK